ncbi:MAG: protein kinase [Deltaproteobacteria bacterium]|nr:protein kinase [Deltaproteobacteria bacterium]
MLASDPQIAVGAILLGEVLIEQELCLGGLGALYRASVSGTGPVFARVMRSSALALARERFPREVSVVRHAEHPSIVSPTQAAIEGDLAVVVYEPTTGTPLCTTLHELGAPTMALSEVGRIVSEVAEILDHAHRQPVRLVHGSLSASSILLAGAKRAVRLLDLGLVQALEQADVFAEARWDVLDPRAASPEVVTRTFPIEEATDVFGLATVAFGCLTGRPAFPARNPAEAQAMIASGKRPSAHALRRELSPDVDRVLEAAWSVDPRGRPLEVLAFADALAVSLARSVSRSVAPPRDARPPGGSGAAPLDEAPLDEEDPTAVGDIPLNARRAMTLPFGLKTNPPRSEPPPAGGPVTVPRMVPAEAMDAARGSERTPAAAAQPDVVTAARSEPSAIAAPPGGPPMHEEREPLRVVSVTALVVSLVIGSAIIVGAALVGGSILVSRRTLQQAPVTPPVVAPPETASPPSAFPPSASGPFVAPPPAPSVEPPAKPAPAASAAAPIGEAAPASTLWPELPKEPGLRPSPKAIETLRERLKIAFEPCVKMTPKPPPGMPWMLHLELDGPSGRPILVEASKPYKGTLAGACVVRAALDARVPPFDSARWAIDLRFGPT